jgi:hypothetical protein
VRELELTSKHPSMPLRARDPTLSPDARFRFGRESLLNKASDGFRARTSTFLRSRQVIHCFAEFWRETNCGHLVVTSRRSDLACQQLMDQLIPSVELCERDRRERERVETLTEKGESRQAALKRAPFRPA